jgi:hypothetical protein
MGVRRRPIAITDPSLAPSGGSTLHSRGSPTSNRGRKSTRSKAPVKRFNIPVFKWAGCDAFDADSRTRRLLSMKHELRAMQHQRDGSIINLSSNDEPQRRARRLVVAQRASMRSGDDEGGPGRTPMPAAPGPVARRELLRSGE